MDYAIEVVAKGAAIQQMGMVLGSVLGQTAGRVVFDLGMLAMAFSTISLHMLVCGFVAMEWFQCPVGSRAYRAFTLLPAPAALAPAVFPSVPVWLAVPTNIACGLLLPVTYVGFFVLQRSRAYLGVDRLQGLRAFCWLVVMGLAIAVPIVSIGYYAIARWL